MWGGKKSGFEFDRALICVGDQAETSVDDLIGRGLPTAASGFGAVVRHNVGHGFRAMK